jgi:hypothetical protein
MRRERRTNWALLAAMAVSVLGRSPIALAAETRENDEAFFALRDSGARFPAAALPADHGFGGGDGGGGASSAPALASTSAATSPSTQPVLKPITVGLPRGYSADSDSGAQLFTIMGVGMFAASAGDLWTTETALSRGGFRELNPLQTNRFARIGTHIAVPALLWWMTARAHDRGNTKLALAMRIGFAVAYGYVTLHNGRTIGSVR